MFILLAAAAMASPTAAAPVADPIAVADHRASVTHHSGAVDASYRGTVTIRHRQTGAAGPGGRPSTLRCAWVADIAVDRAAQAGSGNRLARSFGRDGAMSGSRAGWCDTHRASIAREVASRRDAIDGHVQALALEDHDVLRAELDRLHGPARAG